MKRTHNYHWDNGIYYRQSVSTLVWEKWVEDRWIAAQLILMAA